MPKRVMALTDGDHNELLSHEEEQYVEARARGMDKKKAANAVGFSLAKMYSTERKERVQKALDIRRQQNKAAARVTREQVVQGMLRAIEDAKLMSDPGNQIAGWREIGKMLGYYEPERKVVELADNREEALRQLSQVEVDELLTMAGDDVIDVEFSLVSEDGRPN